MRRLLKRVVRLVVGRSRTAEPTRSETWSPPPRPQPRAEEPEGEGDSGHSHEHAHEHKHEHAHEHEHKREPAHDHAHDHSHSHGHDDHGAEEDAGGDIDIEATKAFAWHRDEGGLLLDIREPMELSHGHVAGARLIPMNQVPDRLAELPKDRRLLLYCAAGPRSHGVAHWLREHGYPSAFSVEGGFGHLVRVGATAVRPPRNTKFALSSRVVVKSGKVPGSVQAISERDGAPHYDIGTVDASGVWRLVPGVPEGDLEAAKR